MGGGLLRKSKQSIRMAQKKKKKEKTNRRSLRQLIVKKIHRAFHTVFNGGLEAEAVFAWAPTTASILGRALKGHVSGLTTIIASRGRHVPGTIGAIAGLVTGLVAVVADSITLRITLGR